MTSNRTKRILQLVAEGPNIITTSKSKDLNLRREDVCTTENSMSSSDNQSQNKNLKENLEEPINHSILGEKEASAKIACPLDSPISSCKNTSSSSSSSASSSSSSSTSSSSEDENDSPKIKNLNNKAVDAMPLKNKNNSAVLTSSSSSEDENHTTETKNLNKIAVDVLKPENKNNSAALTSSSSSEDENHTTVIKNLNNKAVDVMTLENKNKSSASTSSSSTSSSSEDENQPTNIKKLDKEAVDLMTLEKRKIDEVDSLEENKGKKNSALLDFDDDDTVENSIQNPDGGPKNTYKKNKRNNTTVDYNISPVHSDESDVDLSDSDPTFSMYTQKDKDALLPKNTTPPSPESSCSESASASDTSPNKKKGRKREKNTHTWKQNKAKLMRNSGKAYQSMSKSNKIMAERTVKPPCSDKCRLKCKEKINTETRQGLFRDFWNLADLTKQRLFVNSCMKDIVPKYKYSNAENPRQPNKAFYFTINSQQIRVCKSFFKNTLDISDRMITTTKEKTNTNNFVEEERRGKHECHKRVAPELINDIKQHINSIPRIESHYLRANTSREFIDGGKNITDLYNDFEAEQKKKHKDAGKYCTYYKIFTTEFNLGFFQPKKDQCDQCLIFRNSSQEQKEQIKEDYETHHKEKRLSRLEKRKDRKNITKTNKVVVYDLQAVLQSPNGDTSSFFYKSKLNSYNFTVTELTKLDENALKRQQNSRQKNNDLGSYDNVHCFFWNETDGKRGANEIGSCLLSYIESVCNASEDDFHIIFYSDNCCGQNKNKYVATLYLYAVNTIPNLKSITHKFLIKGHTQSEGDNVHSLIEKEIKKYLKSGSIYCPSQYIPLIKNAKKKKCSFHVHEQTHDNFIDLKALQEDWGYNYTQNDAGGKVNWNAIKVLNFIKGEPFIFRYKTSYSQETYDTVDVRNKRKKMISVEEIRRQKLYDLKLELSVNKKKRPTRIVIKKIDTELLCRLLQYHTLKG